MSYPINVAMQPEVRAFFDPATHTVSYIVRDPNSAHCAIVDSVMDIDYAAGKISYANADALIDTISHEGWTLDWIIETHVHADHLSAAPYIQATLGGKLAISANIVTVQDTFGKLFNEGTEFERDGSQFDALLRDGDTYQVGQMSCVAFDASGHTPACMVHLMGDAAFIGDTLFMPDVGSARADFPGGDAAALYDSIQKILALPDAMRVFVCHDYPPEGRDAAWETTVGEQRLHNVHVGSDRSREAFIRLRTERDATLSAPALIFPALQVNMRAGEVPTDSEGQPMLKVPLTF